MPRTPARGLKNMSFAYQAEHIARQMSRELHGNDGLFELFLPEAYRRAAGLPPLKQNHQEKP